MENRNDEKSLFAQQETLCDSYLKKHQKLILLVDLDSTIIVCFAKKVYQTPPKHTFSARNIYFYKRPFLKEFLEDLNPYYEFVIATAAKREYAEAVLKHVDDDGKLFKGRILSREMVEINKINFLDYLKPVVRSMIVAIDDLTQVWDNESFVVEVLALQRRENNDDFHYKDGETTKTAPYLEVLAKSLKKIHNDYYTHYDTPEEKSIISTGSKLAALRSTILKNCNICIKYIPNDNYLIHNIEVVLGSKSHSEVIDTTTHVIVSELINVPKQIIDKFPHVNLVTKEWVFHSLKGLTRCDEDHYKPS